MVGSSNEPLISIVIPVYAYTYHLLHYTGNCIGSIREYSKLPHEIIVVDNNSPIQHATDEAYKADVVIRNAENEGVAKAWNKGIRAAKGRYIVLLNNDTQVYENWDVDMRETLNLGILDAVCAIPMYGDAFARSTEAREKRNKLVENGVSLFDAMGDFKDFACVMFEKKLMDDVGYFDEQFGLGYGEDIDFYRRMDAKGRKYGSSKFVNIYHVIGATSTGMKVIPEIMNENKKKLEDKWNKQLDVQESLPRIWGENVPDALEEKKKEQEKQPQTNPEPKTEDLIVPIVSSNKVVRCQPTGDQVFLIRDNKACWVKTPEVLSALGFGFGDVSEIPSKDFYQLEYGPTITMENVNEFI